MSTEQENSTAVGPSALSAWLGDGSLMFFEHKVI